MKKRILTGDRPTGALHLGHYFGSLKNRVDLLNQGYETFIIIADYQVLTDRHDTSLIEKNIVELVKDYVSVGLDPSKCTIFVQSKIPELAELTVLFSMIVQTSRVSRNPTVKEEINKMDLEGNFSLGMFSYPVSQAADILLFNPNVVPVGEDQLPHLELTREIARKFNSLYGKVFVVPKPLLGSEPRLLGLDGHDKMSKSRGNAIMLKDTRETVLEKIMSAKTDSENKIKYNPTTKPGLSNLLKLYSLVTNESVKTTEMRFKNGNYKELKESLAEAIVKFLEPIQTKRKDITNSQVKQILKMGNQEALSVSAKSIAKVKKAMKMYYGF